MKRTSFLLLLFGFAVVANSFSPTSVMRSFLVNKDSSPPNNNGKPSTKGTTTTTTTTTPKRIIQSNEEAVNIIDTCVMERVSHRELFTAVKYVERYAYEHYPNLASKSALWHRAHGSFELVFSTGGADSRTFRAPPKFLPFSYAMIDDEYFGNGVGLDRDTIWISMLHKHHYDPNIRRMVVTLRDIYIRGHKVTRMIPPFLRKKLNVGKNPRDFTDKDPPTFVIVGVTDRALIARGNQSGGLAIWSRMETDIRPVAYKEK